jgi:hypothetical protein
MNISSYSAADNLALWHLFIPFPGLAPSPAATVYAAVRLELEHDKKKIVTKHAELVA